VSERHGTGQSARLIGVANVALGAVLLIRPQEIARAAAGGEPPGAFWVRLLGGRYLVQGWAQLTWPEATVLQITAAVDALHAASMLALAAGRADYRRPALISAAVATGSAAITSRAARRGFQRGR
jgi:hypothetical protein